MDFIGWDHRNHHWLVVDLPLWKIWRSMGRTIPYIMGKQMFETTNQYIIYIYRYIYICMNLISENNCMFPQQSWSTLEWPKATSFDHWNLTEFQPGDDLTCSSACHWPRTTYLWPGDWCHRATLARFACSIWLVPWKKKRKHGKNDGKLPRNTSTLPQTPQRLATARLFWCSLQVHLWWKNLKVGFPSQRITTWGSLEDHTMHWFKWCVFCLYSSRDGNSMWGHRFPQVSSWAIHILVAKLVTQPMPKLANQAFPKPLRIPKDPKSVPIWHRNREVEV